MAVDAIRAAADLGSMAAKTALAEFHINGMNVSKDDKKGFDLLSEASDANYPRAIDGLAICHRKGIGTKVNYAEAIRLFNVAIEKGFARSYGNLAAMHLNGEGTKQDDFKAVGLLQKGVRLADPFCTYTYARCLETGRGIKLDMILARENYKKAAEGGIAEAQKWCKDHGVDISRPAPLKMTL